MNATAKKFGAPDTIVADYEHWTILLRPAQVTLGSLVLVCKDPVERFGEISEAASTELQVACAALERALKTRFDFDGINYLMLMMVDPDVHFHVLPRYEGEREFAGQRFVDEAWPGPPDVTFNAGCSDETMAELLATLRTAIA